MEKASVLIFLLEFIGFSLFMIYMFLFDPLAWLPFGILLIGVLSCAAYLIRAERRQKKGHRCKANRV